MLIIAHSSFSATWIYLIFLYHRYCVTYILILLLISDWTKQNQPMFWMTTFLFFTFFLVFFCLSFFLVINSLCWYLCYCYLSTSSTTQWDLSHSLLSLTLFPFCVVLFVHAVLLRLNLSFNLLLSSVLFFFGILLVFSFSSIFYSPLNLQFLTTVFLFVCVPYFPITLSVFLTHLSILCFSTHPFPAHVNVSSEA